MKNAIYFFLIVGLLLSCKSNTKHADNDSASAAKPGVDQTADLIQKFKPIVQGVWVKKDYIDKVVQSKSIAFADDKKNGITTMYINTDSIHGDSIVLLAGYYNHDSGNVVVKFKQGKSPSTIQFNGQDLSYTIKNGDTSISVSQYDEQKKQFFKTTFIRVLKRQPENNLGYGMSYAINKGIITGNYLLTDTTGATSKVVFTNDGKVSGFLDFTKYEINFDLNNEPMDNLDEIGFDRHLKTHASFSYKINNDTLSLYDAHANADSTELVLGKRIYKLVKQK
ncbi:MAG: hypothetical protein ACXVA2_12095 [Mucilaginibacter sp.]